MYDVLFDSSVIESIQSLDYFVVILSSIESSEDDSNYKEMERAWMECENFDVITNHYHTLDMPKTQSLTTILTHWLGYHACF